MFDTLTFEGTAPCGSRSRSRPEAACRKEGKTFLIRVFDALGEWQDRSAARRRLAAFDNRMLRDIGIDRATAATESAKPFWQS
jgi:uncharacterized protein YjiS (DUF1127 family)